MLTKEIQRNSVFTVLESGVHDALKIVLPLDYQLLEPRLLEGALKLEFGVLIGITGDVHSRMVLAGVPDVFRSIAGSLYGMALEGDMLASFSGELGNMIAGTFSTMIGNKGIQTAITAPTIMQGDTVLSGYEKAVNIPIDIASFGKLDIFLLLDL